MSSQPEPNAEIKNLQKVRATLEAVREATAKIHQDLGAATENQRAVAGEIARTAAAVERL